MFNFDVPFNAEDYVHRIGRTGRAGASGLAITLVSRDDTRLVADIEKLIHKKIELEPLELDDDAPRRPMRERPRRDDEEAVEQAASPREGRSAAPARSYAREAPRPPSDPFFDKPYEPTAQDTEPAWEKRAAQASRSPSPNIKPKKKVAALFGARVPESAEH